MAISPSKGALLAALGLIRYQLTLHKVSVYSRGWRRRLRRRDMVEARLRNQLARMFLEALPSPRSLAILARRALQGRILKQELFIPEGIAIEAVARELTERFKALESDVIEILLLAHTIIGKGAVKDFGIEWESVSQALERTKGAYEELLSNLVKGSLTYWTGEIAKTAVEAVKTGLPISDVARRLEAEIADLTHKRATLIARTETARLYGITSLAAFEGSGYKRVRWVTAAGSPIASKSPPCPICLDNEAKGWVGIDEEFPSGHRHPPAHPNCRCDIIPDVFSFEPKAPTIPKGLIPEPPPAPVSPKSVKGSLSQGV